MSDNGGTKLRLHLGGTGTPFLTKKNSVPIYKNSDPFKKRPTPMKQVHVDLFDLSNDEQFKQYQRVWQAVGYGTAVVIDEKAQWVDDTKNWKVLIRWYLSGEMDPGELHEEKRSFLQNFI